MQEDLKAVAEEQAQQVSKTPMLVEADQEESDVSQARDRQNSPPGHLLAPSPLEASDLLYRQHTSELSVLEPQ